LPGPQAPSEAKRQAAVTAKRADYYETDRRDFLDWVGGRYPRVLDVGCGAGVNSAWYREHGAVHITGIEPDPRSATAATSVFDRVIVGTVEDVLGRDTLDGPFDLIVCADVLEHLVDPWVVVRQLRGLTTADSVLAVSVPNVRYLRALARIAFGRGFEYEERGIFDSTHLRFFVRRNVADMLRNASWEPRAWGSPAGRFRTMRRVTRGLTRGRSDDWSGYQIYVRATPARDRGSAPTAVPPE
jgi:2-polyprenyl-3-methyl-5-hydroxy-6-metoxy-1,4-benzoquinol methylase